MTEWRPKGFVNPYRQHGEAGVGCRAPSLCEGCDSDLFETGGDAMLKALRDDSPSLGELFSCGAWVYVLDAEEPPG